MPDCESSLKCLAHIRTCTSTAESPSERHGTLADWGGGVKHDVMVAIYEQYTGEMREQFGYLATWLPSAPLALGDVGLLHRDRFQRVTSLQDLGVNFKPTPAKRPGYLEYLSAGQVDVQWGVHADAAAPGSAMVGRAAVTVTFARAHATLFQASGCQVISINDLVALETSLKALAEEGRWRRDYTVISEVVRTGATTIIVSSQAGARVDFRTRATGMAGPLTLANAAGDLHVAGESGIGFKAVAPDGLTPLFGACALRPRLRRTPRLVFRGKEQNSASIEADVALSSDGQLISVGYETPATEW